MRCLDWFQSIAWGKVSSSKREEPDSKLRTLSIGLKDFVQPTDDEWVSALNP